ncbi:MAG: NfeD family protein [Chloroflexi bacterium]|nr:NfeD family protein [Chloroflexota bacterium]
MAGHGEKKEDMCHLIFLVPLVGVPLFWLLPLGYALPINILLWIVFGLLGYKAVRAMMRPAKDGFKSLIGAEATVVAAESQGYGQYLVKAGHELWTARSAECLQPGEKVRVAYLDGIKLVVRRTNTGIGGRRSERDCH